MRETLEAQTDKPPPVVLVLAPSTSHADLAEGLRRLDVCVCTLGEVGLGESDETQRKNLASAVSAALRRNGGMTSVGLVRHFDFFRHPELAAALANAPLVAAAADAAPCNVHIVIDEAAPFLRTLIGRDAGERFAPQRKLVEDAASILAVSAVPCFDSAAGDAASASPLMTELLANAVHMEQPWEKTYGASVCVVDTPEAAESDILGNSGLLRSSGGLSPAVEGAVLAAVHHAAAGGHRHILVATHRLEAAQSLLPLPSRYRCCCRQRTSPRRASGSAMLTRARAPLRVPPAYPPAARPREPTRPRLDLAASLDSLTLSRFLPSVTLAGDDLLVVALAAPPRARDAAPSRQRDAFVARLECSLSI